MTIILNIWQKIGLKKKNAISDILISKIVHNIAGKH